ncbi:MAG: hypothetical protein M1818_003814 [Claussenomyces sp. TS43310]|nr:MAG: hypothetical protein M1818_003814 [Claussenomyces sp. TS43310]
MRLTTVVSLLGVISLTTAFKDTSPYLFFSTSELPSPLPVYSNKRLHPATSVLQDTKEFLATCPSDTYIIISQPNANVDDFSTSRTVPFLRRAMTNDDVETAFSVAEVSGQLQAEDLRDYIKTTCKAMTVDIGPESTTLDPRDLQIIMEHSGKGTDMDQADSLGPKILFSGFEPLPSSEPERSMRLADNDAYLQSTFDNLPAKYSVMYVTSPVSEAIFHPSYDADFSSPLHTEMKRQFHGVRNAKRNSTIPEGAPLFQKYQFFTPGLFMGLIVSFVLLSILAVAISAVSSLKVSYGAFDKEMGPTAQSKQQ